MKYKKRQLVALLSGSVIVTTWGVINICIPAMKQEFPLIPLPFIENVSTIASLFIVVGVLLSQKVAKAIGYKPTILLGLALVTCSGIAPIFLHRFQFVFISRALLGLGIGLFQSLLVQMNTFFYDGEQRVKVFGLQSACEGLGGMLSTLLAGQLILIRWKAVFLVYLLAFFCLLLYGLFVPSVSVHALHAKNVSQDSSQLVRFTSKETIQVIGLFTITLFLSAMYMMIGIKITSLIIFLRYGTASDGALFAATIGFGAMIAGMVFHRFVRWTKNLLFGICLGLFGTAMFIIGVANHLSIALSGAFLAGFSFRTLVPYILHYINSGKTKSAGFATSLILIAVNLGAFISPYIAMFIGVITNISSPRTVFFYLAIILVCASLISLLYARYQVLKSSHITA